MPLSAACARDVAPGSHRIAVGMAKDQVHQTAAAPKSTVPTTKTRRGALCRCLRRRTQPNVRAINPMVATNAQVVANDAPGVTEVKPTNPSKRPRRAAVSPATIAAPRARCLVPAASGSPTCVCTEQSIRRRERRNLVERDALRIPLSA